jgi:hypothetical protein
MISGHLERRSGEDGVRRAWSTVRRKRDFRIVVAYNFWASEREIENCYDSFAPFLRL